MGKPSDVDARPAGDGGLVGAIQEPRESTDAEGAVEKGSQMKALALRLVGLALPIALFVAAAAPYIRW